MSIVPLAAAVLVAFCAGCAGLFYWLGVQALGVPDNVRPTGRRTGRTP